MSSPAKGEYTFEASGGPLTAIRMDVYWDSRDQTRFWVTDKKHLIREPN